MRLIGIDTPETRRPPTSPSQCFGPEASARTTELLPAGTVVRLERDVEARDRYDRLLAYVYRVADGLFVNLRARRARATPRSLTYPPERRPRRASSDRGRGGGAPGRHWAVERSGPTRAAARDAPIATPR